MNRIESMVTDAKRTIQSIKQIDPKAVNACDYLEQLIDRIAAVSLLSKLEKYEALNISPGRNGEPTLYAGDYPVAEIFDEERLREVLD